MKPIYVVLIAVVSALVDGVIGSIFGSLIDGSIGGIGGSVLGARGDVCATTEAAKTKKLLTPEQARQGTLARI